MNKGIYIALSGALLKQNQLETITQNVANANTTGFKRSGISFKDYLIPQDEPGPGPDGRVMSQLSAITTDFTSGTQVRTGNPLDVAIEGKGFIALDEGYYTRRGDMHPDKDGNLLAQNGRKVLGAGGPVRLPIDGTTIAIDANGKIEVDGIEIDTIRVEEFPDDAALTKIGEGMYTSPAPGTPSTGTIMQGYLETSNVNAVTEMVRMIDALREFESYQKIITTFDDTVSKVTNDLGRL